ncbi:uncharacterized protein LOC133183500 [Saccostrea echinata]|uniref:uncharacterized protein LOC133183500 n=1 Tax=Saccostrea echinata TaxID=191078 RepID=UPI002A7EEE7D|nr:uncharacterized protein LOC133183500 [Saccostrea echinata]
MRTRPTRRGQLLILHPAMKVKKQNKVVERQLENTLHFIEQKYHFQTEKLDKSIKSVQRQLENIESDRRKGGIPGRSLDDMYGRFAITPESAQKRRRRRAVACDIGTPKRKHHCSHFPCEMPQTYHSIGFRFQPEDTEWKPWKKIRNDLSDETQIVLENSTLMNTGISRLRAERRADMLKLEMEKRRRKMEEGRPPAWETNYGKPTPIRRLKYPVRLEPLD